MNPVLDPELYLGKVNIPEAKIGQYEIKHIIDPPNHSRDLGTLRTQFFGQKEHGSVIFPAGARWHQLSYDGGVWMTDLPIEQHQANHLLKDAHGFVFMGGLGIGYTANLLAARYAVDEIIIVEISQEVIDLVSPYLIDPDSKIVVIKADALEWIKTDEVSSDGFDVCYLDIWQSDGEDTFFHIVRPFRDWVTEHGLAGKIICWNEDIMRGQLLYSISSRYHMAIEQPSSLQGAIRSIQQLSEPFNSGSKYCDVFHDWSIPFFQRVLDGEITKNNVQAQIELFVANV